jgi:hypothetical protein
VREGARAVRVLAVPCAIACVALAAAAAVPAAGGCTTHQCDSDCVRLGAAPDPTCNEGNASAFGHTYRSGNQIVWETSGSVFEKWLDYTGERTYQLNWQSTIRRDHPDVDLCTLHVVQVDSFVATDESGINFVPAAGQLSEMTYPLVSDDDAGAPQANGQVNVLNATCAEYFLRVVVTLEVGDPYPACHPSPPADAAGSLLDASDGGLLGG